MQYYMYVVQLTSLLPRTSSGTQALETRLAYQLSCLAWETIQS